MNKTRFSVEKNTKKSTLMNINNNKNQKTIKTELNKFEKFVFRIFQSIVVLIKCDGFVFKIYYFDFKIYKFIVDE